MSDQAPEAPKAPTKEEIEQQTHATRIAFADIADLLRSCVFPGALAVRVARAISYLDAHVQAMGATSKVDKAEEKRQKKALKLKKQKGLKVVGDGDKPAEASSDGEK